MWVYPLVPNVWESKYLQQLTLTIKFNLSLKSTVDNLATACGKNVWKKKDRKMPIKYVSIYLRELTVWWLSKCKNHCCQIIPCKKGTICEGWLYILQITTYKSLKPFLCFSLALLRLK